MVRKVLQSAAMASILAGTASCGTLSRHDAGMANTVFVQGSEHLFNFPSVEIGNLVLDNREFSLVPVPEGNAVSFNGKTLDDAVVLDEQALPWDNSTRTWSPDGLNVQDHGELYQFVNTFVQDGNDIVNTGNTPKRTSFVYRTESFPSTMTRGDLGIAVNRRFEQYKADAEKANIGGREFIKYTARNPFSQINGYLIDLETIKPLYEEVSIPGAATKFRFMIDGVGYAPIQGSLVDKPEKERKTGNTSQERLESPSLNGQLDSSRIPNILKGPITWF